MYEVESTEPNDEGRSKLIITDDTGTRTYHDGGEPEDNLFMRDWGWIQGELQRAYDQGCIDGSAL